MNLTSFLTWTDSFLGEQIGGDFDPHVDEGCCCSGREAGGQVC